MSIHSMEDSQAPAQVVAFPAPKPKSRLARDLERSVHAEAIARELAFAVYRTPWFALETWQQIRLRNTAVMAIRSFDETAQAVAKVRGMEALEAATGGTTLDRAAEVIDAYLTHLTVGPSDDLPTAEEDAALARGIATDDDDALTGHGRY